MVDGHLITQSQPPHRTGEPVGSSPTALDQMPPRGGQLGREHKARDAAARSEVDRVRDIDHLGQTLEVAKGVAYKCADLTWPQEPAVLGIRQHLVE
jgi:hypothetical protein